MARPQPLLDTVREVYTPEGVALRLPAAGPVPRAMAQFIDSAIRVVFMLVVWFILVIALREPGAGIGLIVYFIVYWLYPVLFEVLWDGQTPGKRALGLRVISADGAPVGWLASMVRNLLRVVDSLPIFYGVGLVVSYFDPAGRRLGDMVARTLVIHVIDEHHVARLQIQGAFPPAVTLLPHEQQAIIAFAERASGLSPERQRELADIATPVVNAGGEVGLRRLQGVANWLLGRQ